MKPEIVHQKFQMPSGTETPVERRTPLECDHQVLIVVALTMESIFLRVMAKRSSRRATGVLNMFKAEPSK